MERLFLRLAAGGVGIVALGYLLAPHTVIGSLVALPLEAVDQVHIFRAIMGLYSGMVIFWFLCSSRPEAARPAVASVVCFMLGLAFGRTFSMLVDGMPSPFLAGATLVEIAAGAWGIAILRAPSQSSA